MIEFSAFMLESSWYCGNDWLKIYDGSYTNASILGSNGYCGSSKPSAMMSSGNALLIVFVSNNRWGYSGFDLSYKSLGMFLACIIVMMVQLLRQVIKNNK